MKFNKKGLIRTVFALLSPMINIVLKAEQELRRHFGQFISNKQIERSLLLIQGILESKTVNLASCAEHMSRLPDIEYTQEQLYSMFIDHFQTGKYDKLLKSYFLAVFYMTFHLSDGRLAIDRTEWQIGERWHNILTIGYICHDSLVPLVWVDLGRRKNSNTEERIALLNRLRAWWKATGIPLPPLTLYADREFIGQRWFKYLVKNEIAFVIRLKANQQFHLWRNDQLTEKAYSTEVLARYLRIYKLSHVDIVLEDDTIIPFTQATEIVQDNGQAKLQTWFLAAHVEDPENASTHYNSRWSIEVTFGHTKTKGLNLEDFNLVGQHKMEIMLGLVALVYAISVRQAIEEKLYELKIKTYKNGKQYPEKSTFKIGLERVRKIIRNVKDLFCHLLNLFEEVFLTVSQKKYILNKSIVQ